MLKIASLILLFSSIAIFGEGLKFQPLRAEHGSDREFEKLNILAIRVEFVEDQLNKTTGKGKFDLDNSVYPDSLKIDAPPHDKQYFEDHLEYIKNYYHSVSNGLDIIESYTVLDQVYTLPNKMWFYNLNNPDSSAVKRLKMLHRDSWSNVLDDQTIDFSNYNSFVIFHAGSGQEFSTPADATPFDIPSAYLNSKDLEGEFQLTAWDGTIIDNSVILPECEWQIYEDEWYMAGLHGASVLMFSHRLGLPNLYKAEDKSISGEEGKYRSGVGRFDPMDQGSGNFSGLIPAKPSAWSRMYLGWSEVEEIVESREDIPVKEDSLIYKLDINDKEYLLIENRLSHTALKDSMWSQSEEDSVVYVTGYDRDNRKIKLYFTKKGAQKIEVDEGFRVITRVDNYDFAIPASGIFIWHIDKDKTTPYHIAENKINSDFKNKGVYLEEADGSFQIGEEFSLFDFGYGKDLGWLYDAYFDSNYVWKNYANKDLYREIFTVEFSDRSYPASDSNDKTKTGIRFYNFSNPGKTASFSYSVDNMLEGYPFNSQFDHKNSLLVDGNLIMINQNIIRVYDNENSFQEYEIVDVSNEITPIILDGKVVMVTLEKDGLLTFDPQNGEYDLEENYTNISLLTNQLVIDDHRITISYGTSQSYDIELENPIFPNHGAVVDGKVIVVTDNQLQLYSQDTSLKTVSIPFNCKLKLFNNEDKINIMVHTSSYGAVYDHNLEVKHNNYSQYYKIVGVDDLDLDGKPEYLAYSDETLVLYTLDGVVEDNFPVRFSSDLRDDINYYSFNSDGVRVIALVDSRGNFKFTTNGGEILRGSSFNAGNRDSCNYQFLEKSGELLLYSISKEGIVKVYSVMDGDLISSFNSGDNFSGTNNPSTSISREDQVDGSGIVGKGNVYNWPNPIRFGSTNFRFYLNKPSNVEIEIFDITGDRVDKLEKNFSTSGDYFEIKWEPKVASGVYFAKVKFNSTNGSEEYTVKTAVVR